MEKQNALVRLMAVSAMFLVFKGLESVFLMGSDLMKHASKRVQKELN